MRALIFDLDGTLVDSLDDITSALNHALVAHGLAPHPRAVIEGFVGEGSRALVRHAMGEARGGALEDEVFRHFRARYQEHLVVDTRPYPGVPALLETLAARGVPTAVLSNKPHAMTQGVVRALFPDHPFVEVRGELPPTPAKPDPTSALALLEPLGAAASDVLFVGDTEIDLETARRAGMIPVGVTWGMRTRAELAAAAHLVDEAAQILALVTAGPFA